MPSSKVFLPLAVILAAMVALSACGSDDETTDAGDDAAAAETSDDTAGDQESTEDDDHDDHEGEDEHDDHDGDDDHDHDHDEAEGGLGAHEHGVAELSVAWSDGDMVIDLISPTFNIFGRPPGGRVPAVQPVALPDDARERHAGLRLLPSQSRPDR